MLNETNETSQMTQDAPKVVVNVASTQIGNLMQWSAIRGIRRHLDGEVARNYAAQPYEVTEFAVTATDYGVYWVKAQLERTTLPEGNLLRALDRQYWLFAVGERGGVTVHMAPKPLHQFAGKRAFGWNFAKEVA